MGDVNASIITIGDELLIGQTIDTNSAFIAQQLNGIGIWVRRRLAVGDVEGDILQALASQSAGAQVVILTGGLGPTADDITRPVLCRYFDTEMKMDAGTLQHIEALFARRNRPLTERNRRQAEVPAACTVLPNHRGTAPGMWFEKEGVIYISLPGVPHEMRGLMETSVLPRLRRALQLPAVLHRTLLIWGLAESSAADLLEPFEGALPQNIKLAYLPAYGQIRLRLTGRGADKEALEAVIDMQFKALQEVMAPWIMVNSDSTVPAALQEELLQQGATVATAESCTGGYIAHLITEKAGASAVFLGAVVAYHNDLKTGLLGVQPQTLEAHGAVSEATVREMLLGLLQLTGAHYGIATSGIMGPTGGSDEKPVGTVWIAVGSRERMRAEKHFFPYDRARNIEMAAQTALAGLLKFAREKVD